MALSESAKLALAVSFFGLLSFAFGILAELNKPPYGTPIQMKDSVMCTFPSDPTVPLGVLSVITVIISTVFGAHSVFFPYQGKYVPRKVLFQNTMLFVLFIVAVGCTLLGAGLTSWAVYTEAIHHLHNVHSDPNTECATAKTGLLGGSAFLNLDSCLFWLVCLMVTHNVREDHFDENTEDSKGEYGEVTAPVYDEYGA